MVLADWSALAIPAVPVLSATAGPGESADDGGLRQQPELSERATYSSEAEPSVSDLALLDDDDFPLPLSAALPSQFDPRLQRTARLAALDPDDGIQL